MTWPDLPKDAKDPDAYAQILFQAQVDLEVARRKSEALASGSDVPLAWEREKQDFELEKAAAAAEDALNKAVHDARLEVSKGAIDRARSGAESVRNTAAAVGTIYTGVAALAFAAKDKPLPATGVIPALFLGLALVLSAAYVGWLGRAPGVPAPLPHSSRVVFQGRRLNAFADWTANIVLHKKDFLRSAVLSLGAAVILLPLPFLDVPGLVSWILAAVLLAVVLFLPKLSIDALQA